MTKAKPKTQKPAAAAKPQARTKTAAPATGGAFGALAADTAGAAAMADNDAALHQGLHDMHDAAQHAESVHGDDAFPENWNPPAQLETPPERPGMVQRWVRMSLVGKADPNNLAMQGQQGWRPRSLDTVPEGDRKKYPTTRDQRTGGQFMINNDLVLCEMPVRLFKQMSAFYKQKRVGQVTALVDEGLKADVVTGGDRHGIGAPYVAERSSKVTTARVPIVAAD